MIKEFGVLCCLTTPGLRKDMRRQIRQLYSQKVTYYVHYNYILSSHLLSHSRFISITNLLNFLTQVYLFEEGKSLEFCVV